MVGWGHDTWSIRGVHLARDLVRSDTSHYLKLFKISPFIMRFVSINRVLSSTRITRS
jgi:hypothetical protein